MGCANFQSGSNPESIVVMDREDAGGKCEFNKVVNSTLRLFHVVFIGRKTIGNEKVLH